jgi:hypothetical protein
MKLKWILLGLVLLCAASIVNASVKKKKTKRKKTATTQKQLPPIKPGSVGSSLPLCTNSYNFPYWGIAVVQGFQYPKNIKEPKIYKLASIINSELLAYLHSIPYETEKAEMKKIQLPIYRNGLLTCKEYHIVRVETMDSALQAKYPLLMSFRAFDPNDGMNNARIDCDGISAKALINDEGETFFLTPVTFLNQIFYSCYSKNDPNFIKDDFEINRR